MKTLSTTAEEMADQPVPWWIEPKVRHYIKLIQRSPITDVCFFEITTLSQHLTCRVMFKREATSVDTMSCTEFGAQSMVV